jgi:hypothetical protein
VGLGKELLELVVLGLKLSKLGSVGRLHAAKAGAPLVEGWLAKATGAAKFLDGHARVSLFEETDDLLIGKSGLFHSRYSPKLADFVPSLWYGREGEGQSRPAPILMSPLVKRRIAGAHLSVNLINTGSGLYLLMHNGNLLAHKSALFHCMSPF